MIPIIMRYVTRFKRFVSLFKTKRGKGVRGSKGVVFYRNLDTGVVEFPTYEYQELGEARPN